MLSPHKLPNWVAIILAFQLLYAGALYADTELILITTLPVGTDSTEITSITPIGDFNADGYPDLLIGEGWTGGQGNPRCLYEAAHLFYGGPDFDSLPDLTFQGDPQGDICLGVPLSELTGFGSQATGLDDFNGDGFDDVAIGAPYFCEHSDCNGRIYIFGGGPNADTIADLILTGQRDFDLYGQAIRAGDYNGDGLGDLLVLVSDAYYGTAMSIYLGSGISDTTTDWSYNPGHNLYSSPSRIYGGHDITGDGKDDFGWRLTNNIFYIFLGGTTLPAGPVDSTSLDYPWFPGDISGDAIEDIIFWTPQGQQLCLGGNPFDLIPDYPIGYYIGAPLFTYIQRDGMRMLAGFRVNWDSLFLYNLGVPFDSFPANRFYFGSYFVPDEVNMGDLTGDGADEMALENDSISTLFLFSIVEVSAVIDDSLKRQNSEGLSCYPNPFNDAAIILINSAAGIKANFEIGIYDITGRVIAALTAENGRAVWDASGCSSGLYFARANGNMATTIKLVLVK